MSEESKAGGSTADQKALDAMIADSDTGGRNPTGISKQVLWFVPLSWALFQVWYASPLPYIFNIGLFNSTEARSIHLAFAVFLAFTAFPTFKTSPRDFIPIQDWVVALVGAFCAGYLFLFYAELAERPGLPTDMDIIVSCLGLVLILEATRRALGPPLMIVALVFMG